MLSWDDVRRISLALPGVTEEPSWGNLTFKVNGRAFVHPGRVEGAIFIPLPDEETQLLLRAKPDVYFQTPHYEGHGVLFRLDAADEDELAGTLEDAYAYQAAKKPLRPRAARTRRGSR